MLAAPKGNTNKFVRRRVRQMSFHTCWDVKAPEDTPGVPVPEVLNRLAMAFPVHSFDAEGAIANLTKQVAAMESLGIPEEILAW